MLFQRQSLCEAKTEKKLIRSNES